MSMLARAQNVGVLQRLLHSQAVKRADTFNRQDPLAAQQRIFRELLESGATTQFGRDNNFARIRGVSFDAAYRYYQNRVPIRSYQNFMTDYFYLNQPTSSMGGSVPDLDNITWPDSITMFCETSGTTAPTKFIPFSAQMFAENRRAALDMMACYLTANPESQILQGKVLYMSGSTRLTKVKRGVWSGDMSALTLRFRPWYLSAFVEPSAKISALPWEEKLQAMAELLVRDNQIRVISGVPPWIILLLSAAWRSAASHFPDYCRI